MYQIKIWGEASQSTVAILDISQFDQEKNLMLFLRNANIPLASSCFGEGICNKCLVNGHILACQTILKDLFNLSEPSPQIVEISISYL